MILSLHWFWCSCSWGREICKEWPIPWWGGLWTWNQINADVWGRLNASIWVCPLIRIPNPDRSEVAYHSNMTKRKSQVLSCWPTVQMISIHSLESSQRLLGPVRRAAILHWFWRVWPQRRWRLIRHPSSPWGSFDCIWGEGLEQQCDWLNIGLDWWPYLWSFIYG